MTLDVSPTGMGVTTLVPWSCKTQTLQCLDGMMANKLKTIAPVQLDESDNYPMIPHGCLLPHAIYWSLTNHEQQT